MFIIKSQLKNFNLPLLIPKRNKGHNEVFGSISIKSKDSRNAEDFVGALLPLTKTVVSTSFLSSFSEQICEDFRLKNLTLGISFYYHLNRTSPQFLSSSFQSKCFYKIKVEEKVIRSFIGIQFPIRIKDIFPIQGRLSFFVEEPKTPHFEDLIDHVQKYAGARLYPKVSSRENLELKNLIDEGKTPQEYFDVLINSSTLKGLGKGGSMKIITKDVYHSYNISFSSEWDSNYVKNIIHETKVGIEWENTFIDRLAREIIDDLKLSLNFYIDVFLIVFDTIQWWKKNTDSENESIKNKDNLVYKLIKNEAESRIKKELELWEMKVA